MEILKKNIPIVISLLIAVIAGVLIYTVIKSMTPTVPVVVAKDHIMVGEEITKDKIIIVNYPQSMVPNNSFRTTEDVVGNVVINGPIINGNMIRADNISDISSLRASLNTFALEPGWTAVELPPGGALGMSNLRRGDKVDIYSEVGNEQGVTVGLVCKDAIVLDKPVIDKSTQFIVAVPQHYAPAVAEIIILDKPMTLTLNNTIEVVQKLTPQKEILEETLEEINEPLEESQGGSE